MHQMMEACEHQKKAFVSRPLEDHRKQESQAPLMYNRSSVKTKKVDCQPAGPCARRPQQRRRMMQTSCSFTSYELESDTSCKTLLLSQC